jgi:MFS family permease
VSNALITPEEANLRPLQLFFLAAAVFVASAGYGALLPLLPGWLSLQIPGSTPSEVARHVGFLSGAYAAGVLIGAPTWGLMSDRVGRSRILIFGLIGYVASLLLLLLPLMGKLWAIYALRATAGLFVAAVVSVVPALVAAHTPKAIRARRFAWLGAASLLGFLFGPGLNAVADALARVFSDGSALIELSTQIVIVLAASLSGAMMLGMALTLPANEGSSDSDDAAAGTTALAGFAALWWLSVAVNLVLSGFEIGIVLQGRQHSELSTQQVALMFAVCSLVMLAINALLFLTALLDKVSPRLVVAVGSLLAMGGLAVLALHQTNEWMYIGVSLTSAGTGLVLPVITFLSAGASHKKLGATMGGLAAAGALGQVLGSAAGGWLFGAVARLSFAWLSLPLLLILIVLLLRSSWWKAAATAPDAAPLPPPN